jgi:hypothetical protein
MAKTPKPNPHGAIVCCLMCGRDTRATSALCIRCSGGSNAKPMQRGERPPWGFEHEVDEDDYSEDSRP